jgi:putative endopeptidase
MALHHWPRLKLMGNPGRSFYLSVNKSWLDTHKIPAWLSEYSVSSEVTNKTDKELLEILHSIPNLKNTNYTPTTPREHLQLLGYIWKNKTIESEEAYLQVCLYELLNFKGAADIAMFLGWMVRCSIPTLISISARRELDPPFLIRASLSPGSLLLPEEYYLDPILKKTYVWTAYEKFISTCSIELGLPFLHKAIEAEHRLAKILMRPFLHLSQSKRGASWKTSMPEFEWQGFMAGLDIDSAWGRRIWMINSTERFKDIIKWICTTDQESLIAVLSIHLIRFAAPYLRSPIKEAYNNLFLKALVGINTMPSEEKYMLRQIKTILPDALCNLYSKHNRDPKIIEGINTIVSKLKESAIHYMENSSLITRKTRTKIIEKIHRMKFILGNSESSSMPRVVYTPDSFLHTICSINSARTRSIPNITGKTTDKIHSDYPCFITNASYFEESNDVFIPWGILQSPFYIDSNESLGWNYGGIGSTIGHEINHAFDLEGSLFSPRGQFKSWWTRRDRNAFKRQTRKMSNFYGKFKHFGKKVNGKKTLSENWADLGGLKIALHSLDRELSKNNASDKEKKEAHRNFFIAYAFCWRTLARKKSLLYSMDESVHSIAEDRVDRIVPQFQEWVDAFDIKESDPLYLPPGKRLKFF